MKITDRQLANSLNEDSRLLILNSPSNPTGNLLSERRMRAIAGLSPYIVSDEIYHGLVYEGQEHSILEFTDRAFVFNGFSKLYAMTGFYGLSRPPVLRALAVAIANLVIANILSLLVGNLIVASGLLEPLESLLA